MRISRRSLAAAVVLGTTVVACVASEHLSSTNQKAVVFLPATSYDFGGVPVGSGSATNPDPYFTIRAQSETDNDFVTQIVLGGTCGSDFTLDLPPPLPGGSAEVYCSGTASGGSGPAFVGGSAGGTGTCVYIDYLFGAFFHPTAPGMQTCPVFVTTYDTVAGLSNVTTITLTGTGLQTTYAMTANPPSINFGDVALSTTSGGQSVTVTNTGGATIHVSGVNNDPTHFLVNPAIGSSYPLNPTQSAQFTVACQAGATPATYMSSLTFSTQSTEGPVMKTVTLACNAAVTSISAIPNPVDLGTHMMGDSPTTVPVKITNTSAVQVTLDNYAFSGEPVGEVTYSPTPGPSVLPPSGFTTVNVRYAPTTERDFGSLGTMTFTVNAMGTSVPMVGGAHAGSIGTNPGMLDFGPVCAGSNASLDLAVFANAGADVTLSAPTGPGAPFTASLSGAPITLAAHHANEATIMTAAMPSTSATPGDIHDTLNLMTNIPGQSTVPIDVHALVLAGGVAPDRTMVHFGPNDLGKPSPVQMVALTNCGAADLTLTDATFTGSNGDEFAVVSPADVHVTIPKTKTQEFLIVMTPKTAGAKSAELDFVYAGGTSTVALDGTGIGAVDTGGTKDRETYYACSTGTPTGFAPLAFAALLLRRRRRR